MPEKKEVAMHHTDCNMHGTEAMLLNSGVWPVALPEIMRYVALHVVAIASYIKRMTMP